MQDPKFPLLTTDETRALKSLAGSNKNGEVLAGLFQRTLAGAGLASTALQTESDSKIASFASAVSVGGGVSEVMTVTGLLATDTVLSVDIKTMGANPVTLKGWSTVANNALTCQFSADPGAGLVVQVTVKKA